MSRAAADEGVGFIDSFFEDIEEIEEIEETSQKRHQRHHSSAFHPEWTGVVLLVKAVTVTRSGRGSCGRRWRRRRR